MCVFAHHGLICKHSHSHRGDVYRWMLLQQQQQQKVKVAVEKDRQKRGLLFLLQCVMNC